MNKLLLVCMLVLLCISNTSASRFLEDVNPTQTQPEIKSTEDTKKTPTATIPVDEEKKQIVEQPKETNQQQEQIPSKTTEGSQTEKEVTKEEKTTEKKVEKEQENKEEQKKDEEKKEPIVIPPTDKDVPNKQEEQKNDKKEEENKNKQEEQKDNKEQEQNEKKKEESLPVIVDDKKDTSYFGLSFGFVLILALGVLFFFAGFYRYSLKKYKIPPFTPPTFCPNFLFPRPENDPLMEDYYIQNGTEMGGVNSSEKYHNFY